ncbi:pentapeptide repeat-containing protein [Actinophytocola sp. NPDC049390]|uniref:pentapeptide repeat-containing protein n=1 Tax=Actinophytocola sp. NPDC049390 TaxID=3363894 RepID=UPI0037B80F95
MAAGAAVICLFTGVPQPTASAEPGRCPTVAPPGAADGRLACADLRGVDLAQDDLAGADLHGADLRDAYLVQTDLAGADLAGADLRGADLAQADLRGADLTGAVLTGADLVQADLTGVDARGAEFGEVDLSQADLRHADLRDADLRGADLTQALVDDLDLRGANLADIEWLDAEKVRLDTASLRGHRQISWLLCWPALALALIWWRARTGHLVRHRATTPVRAAEVVMAGAAVALTVGGLLLLATGAARAIARQAMAYLRTVDPGPLSAFGAEPAHQLLSGAVAVVIACVLFPLARSRRPPRRRAPRTGQVVIGGPETRGAAVLRRSRTDGPESRLVSVSGLVLAGGGHEPYVLVAGRTDANRPVSRVLPWHALTHVHLIRVLGTAHANQAVVTLHEPGADAPTEYAKELHITGAHVIRLRATLPAEMITDSVRAPSSD